VRGAETLVRVHEPFSAMDVLDAGSKRHSWNLNEALATVSSVGRGVIVLLHRQENAHELLERVRSAADEPPREKIALRNYGIGAQILKDLGVTRMRLLAVPRKMPSMTGFDLEVTGYLQPGDPLPR
jgi:3,4-dihydroxy 2-butanone 4-phosphate synthase/GTP cyclohydrolase II